MIKFVKNVWDNVTSVFGKAEVSNEEKCLIEETWKAVIDVTLEIQGALDPESQGGKTITLKEKFNIGKAAWPLIGKLRNLKALKEAFLQRDNDLYVRMYNYVRSKGVLSERVYDILDLTYDYTVYQIEGWNTYGSPLLIKLKTAFKRK